MKRILNFKTNPEMLKMWKRYELAITSGLSFEETITRLEDFIGPIYNAIEKGKIFAGTWSSNRKKWSDRY